MASLVEKYELDHLVGTKKEFDREKDWLSEIRRYPRSIKKVPSGEQTEEMVVAAVCSFDNPYQAVPLKHRSIASRFKTDDFADKLLHLCSSSIVGFPSSLQTKDRIREALLLPNGAGALALLGADEILSVSDDQLISLIQTADLLSLASARRCIPETRMNEAIREAVEARRSVLADSDPLKAKPRVIENAGNGPIVVKHPLVDYTSEGKPPSVFARLRQRVNRFFGKAPESRQLFIERRQAPDGLSERHQPLLSIWYVSDLHLEWIVNPGGERVFESSANAVGALKSVASSILAPVREEEESVLLLAGDTAENPKLLECFFRALAITKRERGLKCDIVAVMGNHERRSLDDAAFKELAGRNGVIPLCNDLFIKYKGIESVGGKPVVVSEGDLAEADFSELSKIAIDSDYAIFGGLGYSGLNPRYNANIGLYGDAISGEEDVALSERFAVLFEKVLSSFDPSETPLVVLSHTPVEDWHRPDTPLGGAIYVNGHTHHQEFLDAPYGPTILANNQVGYVKDEKEVQGINAFCYRVTYKSYEPLKDIEDGIHKITKQEYALYLKWSGEHSKGCSYPGDLWVIQNEGYRMFVLETSRSRSLLNKGQRVGPLKHPLDYYYDNLPKYARAAERYTCRYLQARGEISKRVKKAGGSGNEHGCIVDFDELTHLFFNPYDASLHCYAASSIVSKRYFQNFSSMLNACGLQSSAIKRRAAEKLDELCIAGGHRDYEYYEGTEQYALSNLMMKLERVGTKQIVTAWSDDLLNSSLDSVLLKTGLMRITGDAKPHENCGSQRGGHQAALPEN